jgi:N-carbamoyl-D-amino-acid hydrolase
MRSVTVAAAQMGPNNESARREEIAERMLALLEQAKAHGVELIAYPEMALTTYFPKKTRKDFDQFFETEMPPKALAPLLGRARDQMTPVRKRWNFLGRRQPQRYGALLQPVTAKEPHR